MASGAFLFTGVAMALAFGPGPWTSLDTLVAILAIVTATTGFAVLRQLLRGEARASYSIGKACIGFFGTGAIATFALESSLSISPTAVVMALAVLAAIAVSALWRAAV